MALVLKDRVKETTTTTGNGNSYTLAGAVTGFESFSTVGDGNTTYYCCTNGTDFEIGIGTYTASGTTLSRSSQNVFQSSNGDALVDWGVGTKDIFITQPADKAVFLDDSGDIHPTDGTSLKLTSTGGTPVINITGGGPNTIRFHDSTGLNSTGNAVDISYRTTPNDLVIERASGENIAEFGGDDGHAALYFNDSKKLETTTLGTKSIGIHVVEHTTGFGAVEVGGPSGGHIDLKAPNSDDYDFRLIHTGSSGASQIQADDLHIQSVTGAEDYITAAVDGAVQLYYDNASKLATTSDGVDITGKVTGDLVELAAGVTYDPPGSSGNDTATDVALALLSGTRIALGHNGFIRTLLETTWGSPLKIGQSQTGGIFNTEIYGGSTSVKLFYDTAQKLQTLSDGIQINGALYFEGTSEDEAETRLTVDDPSTDRTITLPDADGTVRVVRNLNVTANRPTGWTTIAVLEGNDSNGARQRMYAKFTVFDISSSRHNMVSFFAQHAFGEDDAIQVLGYSTYSVDSITGIRLKTGSTYGGAAIQVYIADATNNLLVFLDECNLDDLYDQGTVTLKDGIADGTDPGNVGNTSGNDPYSGFTEKVQVNLQKIEPGGIATTGDIYTYSGIKFEGSTKDANEITLAAQNATADRTITLPDATGYVVLRDTNGNIESVGIGESVFPSGTTNIGMSRGRAFHIANPPENDDHVFHPYLNNDLGHFIDRGGSYAWGGLSSNPTEATTKQLFNANADTVNILDSSISGSSYTLTLTNLPKGQTYSSYIGIVFGHDTFAPGSIVIETSTDGGSNWTTRLNDSSSKVVYACTYDTGGTPTNAIRFTFTASPGSNMVRIQTIAAYNYNSAGMENYFLPLRGGTVFGNTTINGTLSATTKSFDIAHPTKENMRLRYGSLEGPENGVYVRGRLTGSSVIELPEHWAGLVDEDSITVQLTAIGKSQDLWVEDVSIEQVKVCDTSTDCFYMVMAERIDVAKLEVEYAN